MASAEGDQQYETFLAVTSPQKCCVGISKNDEEFHLSIMVKMKKDRWVFFEWTTEGLHFSDYDERIIVGAKPLGEFTISQVLQSATSCSRFAFNKVTNNCKKWSGDVIEELKKYNKSVSSIDPLLGLLVLKAIMDQNRNSDDSES